MKYVSVIIDKKANATNKEFYYSSEKDDIKKGDKVIIPFAKSRTPLEAFVISVEENKPEDIKNLKSIIRIDKEHSLNAEMIDAVLWMSERYFLRKIDAINCFASKEVSKKTQKKTEKYVSPEFELNLTGEQEEVKKKIDNALENRQYKTFLLHGVTGSGKTESYISATKKCFDLGKKVIMLVPEISLTMQTINRFEEKFNRDKIEVIHSKLSKGEKYLAWQRIKNNEVNIVIGARSAIFAPLENLGLIIIDEEHEGSYKSDMTPKYDAIEVALKRAHINNAVTVLGSATPSIISMYRAKIGYYELLTLNKRYQNTPLPKVEIVDMKEELFHGNTSVFSDELYKKIIETKERDKQIILFLNRRGYAPSISCTNCGETLKCPDCDISLTYHKDSENFICHFCGRVFSTTKSCPTCKQESLKFIGIGTEKLEEITKENFSLPNEKKQKDKANNQNQKVIRIDLDTIRKKTAARKLLKSFSDKKADILIGTQIIAKGLDFENVLTCGIVLADLGLNFPDYRAAERTFSLIVQTSGRAGRRDEKGSVIVQTYKPKNYAIKYAAAGDYENFFNEELRLRKLLLYPPFSDFLQIMFTGENENIVSQRATQITTKIKNDVNKIFNGQEGKNEEKNIIGPAKAPVSKIKNKYRYFSYIKVSNDKKNEYWKLLKELIDKINLDKKTGILVGIDVNPYSFL